MAQEETETTNREQQLENLAEANESETEDDSYLQSLEIFKKNKLNINTADVRELRELKILTDLQIQSLLRYRQLLGKLVSIYELQAVPYWNVDIIRNIFPFITVGETVSMKDDIYQRFTQGQHSLVVRAQQILEESEGFTRPDSITNRYLGSRQRIFTRYRYNYRNLLQYGIVGDKDAGEQFLKGSQNKGFDFYSFHLFIRKLGRIKELALGDFTVNMGQGLIQWQSLAFRKSPDVTAVKRQASVLRPYNSAGEYNFYRGVGITVSVAPKIEATAFGSIRQLDANFQADTLQNQDDFFSSIINSGFHRTPSEIENKNTITQTTYGGNIAFNGNGLHLGANVVAHQFSDPFIRNIQPYNQYSIQGESWHNASIDYSYTYKNLHVFGEAAMSKNNGKAFLNGLLVSVDQRVDMSLVYRNISKEYQALYATAFTENTFPTNESGLYTGISLRPAAGITINAYADVFSFPWLRFRVDAPSRGADYLVQINYKPNKQVEIYSRYRNETKEINLSGQELPFRSLVGRPRQIWRTHIVYKPSRTVTLKSRVENLWFDPRAKDRSEQGFTAYTEFGYKPFGKKYAANARLQYFETDGYDSRVYAYESDVLYSFSIPALSGQGLRYYANINYDISKKVTCWFRWAQTIYNNQSTVGSSLDEIDGNRRTEVKLQVQVNF